MAVKGIDVSKHNGIIDFSKVKKAGYDFVIIRAGYGFSTKDLKFEENYAKAKAAGLGVGAYWFTYASTPEEARQEAEGFIKAIHGKIFEYPLYYDLEDDPNSKSYPLKTGKSNCTDMVVNFCSTLEKAGYFAGLYTSKSVLETHIEPTVRSRYALWVAQWSSKCTYNGVYGMWQYSDKGKVDGISGNTDLDYCYIDYPTAMKAKGINGFPKQSAVGNTADKKEKHKLILEFDTAEEAEAVQLALEKLKSMKVRKADG